MRRAFTLIEVLVVVFIIGLLVVLLFPAIQSGRESARRLQCANNLKQIGIAVLAYEANHKVLPPGYVSDYDDEGNDTGPGWGWAAHILPEMEEGPIYRVINFELPIEDPVNAIRVAKIPSYFCPSEDLLGTWRATTSEGQLVCEIAAANYVGMYGTTEPGVDGNGLFFRNSKVEIRDITDGTTRTIAVGERTHHLGRATWAGAVTDAILFPDDESSEAEEIPEHASGMVLGHAGEGVGPGADGQDVNQFYSLHGQGTNFLFADGHITFLSSSIDYKTYQSLATRAGNEPISGDY